MSGREIIARQRALIERCSLLGYDTSWFEESLTLFERCQISFEDDLERIARECQ